MKQSVVDYRVSAAMQRRSGLGLETQRAAEFTRNMVPATCAGMGNADLCRPWLGS